MTKFQYRKAIKTTLLANKDLATDEIDYVRKHFEPKYENDCAACRFNVMLALGVPYDLEFNIVC